MNLILKVKACGSWDQLGPGAACTCTCRVAKVDLLAESYQRLSKIAIAKIRSVPLSVSTD